MAAIEAEAAAAGESTAEFIRDAAFGRALIRFARRGDDAVIAYEAVFEMAQRFWENWPAAGDDGPAGAAD